MPVLSTMLQSMQVRGSVYFCSRLQPPWDVQVEKKSVASFHHVRSGQCELLVGQQRYRLQSGDLVFLPTGDSHRLRSPDAESRMAERADGRAGRSGTVLLCGNFSFRDDQPHPLIEALPSALVITAEQVAQRPWLKSTLEHIGAEYLQQEPGAMVVVNKLTEILLVELIRQSLEQLQGNPHVEALLDRHLGKALCLLHETPGHQWTLAELAGQAAISRAALARKFRSLLGRTMYSYLTELRMNRARELLLNSVDGVADIGEQVGYQSDLAFVRAFKAWYGFTPRQLRQQSEYRPGAVADVTGESG